MRITVGVCEDLEEERYTLARMILSYAGEHGITMELESYGSGEELMSRFTPHRWDILFLDIYMGRLSGADAARQIRERDADCALIFCTTSREHGMLSYALRVSDYLTKPFTREDVDNALDWVLEERQRRSYTLTVRADWEDVKIPLEQIQYAEVYQHSILFHLKDQTLKTRGTMAEIECQMRGCGFYRCHRSFLVNFYYVAGVDGAGFRMRDGQLVPISPRQKNEAKQRFLEWALEKNWGKESQYIT